MRGKDANPRVVTIHRPDEVSGVSSVGSRFAALQTPHISWRPVVIGPESRDDSRSPLRTCPGFVRVAWSEGAGPVEQCLALREAIARIGAEVVICNDLPQAFVASVMLSHRGVRTVSWVHGDDHDWDELLLRAGPLIDAWTGVNRRIVLRSKALGAGLPEPSPVLTGCVRVLTEPAVRVDSAQTLRLLYTGRIEKRSKRVLDLVLLADVLTTRGVEFKLSIVGDGPALQELSERAWSHVLAGRIDLLGAMPLHLVPELVRRHDVLVLVSASEGAPTSVMEALAQGRPVAITTGCGMAAELVRDGVEGFVVETGDMLAMADRLASFWRGASDRALMESAALALAKRSFSEEAVALRADAFVRQAAACPGRVDPSKAGSIVHAWNAMVGTMSLLGEVSSPALKSMAKSWVADLGVRDPGLRLDAPRLVSREGRLLTGVLDRLSRAGCARVALYGAGWHTRKLSGVLDARSEIVAILDDRAGEESGPPAHIGSRPVLSPREAGTLRLDAVVISSDEHEREMLAKARIWAGETPVVPIYEAA